MSEPCSGASFLEQRMALEFSADISSLERNVPEFSARFFKSELVLVCDENICRL